MLSNAYNKYTDLFRRHIPKVFPFVALAGLSGIWINAVQQNEIDAIKEHSQRSDTAFNGVLLTQTSMDANIVLDFLKSAAGKGHINKDFIPAYNSPYDFEYFFNSQNQDDRKRFVMEAIKSIKQPQYTPNLYMIYGSLRKEQSLKV